MCLLPVLLDLDPSWTPFNQPSEETLREPPGDVLEQNAPFGWASERLRGKAMTHREQWDSLRVQGLRHTSSWCKFASPCRQNRLVHQSRIRKHQLQSCWHARERDMGRCRDMTHASRVALPSQEDISTIEDSPEPLSVINSCHLSASCVES